MLHRASSELSSKEKDNIAKHAGIQFPVIPPIFSSPPDAVAVNNWVNAHASLPRVKEIAAKIAQHIDYIPFQQFLSQLQETVNHFDHSVREPYVLVVAGGVGRSNNWVAGLALEQCGLRWPKAIISPSQVNTYLQENLDVRNILLLDDASYSADQIINILLTEVAGYPLDSIPTSARSHVWIGIPFMTTHAENEILSCQRFPHMHLLPHARINMLKEVLDEKEEKYLLDEFNYKCSRMTLTYFDHIYPDAFSSVPGLDQGWHLLRTGSIMLAMSKLGYEDPYSSTPECWNKKVDELLPQSQPLMPQIIRPYRLLQKQTQNELKTALQENRMGPRTSFSVSDRLQKEFETIGIKLDCAVSDIKKLTDGRKSSPSVAQQGLFATSTHVRMGATTLIPLTPINLKVLRGWKS